MNAAIDTSFPRLPPPAEHGRSGRSPTALHAHVWLEASNFFTRESAQQFCWLWLLGAASMGDDHYAKSVLAKFSAEPDLPIWASRALGPALPLLAAPIVPLSRWHISWGHPLQKSLRTLAAQLDQDVMAALGTRPFARSEGKLRTKQGIACQL